MCCTTLYGKLYVQLHFLKLACMFETKTETYFIIVTANKTQAWNLHLHQVIDSAFPGYQRSKVYIAAIMASWCHEKKPIKLTECNANGESGPLTSLIDSHL